MCFDYFDMCVYVCICMNMCVYVRICVYVCVNMCVYVYMCVYVCICVCDTCGREGGGVTRAADWWGEV